MSQNYETQSWAVNGLGCSYRTLAAYNPQAQAPVPKGTASMAVQVVPSFGNSGFGYKALQHGDGAPSCAGYFGISRAYPNQGQCGQYASRACQ